MIHFDVVTTDFDFKSYESLTDIPNDGFLCIIKKTEGYSCSTYSHYTAEVVDLNGAPSSVNYHGYVFSLFKITGRASDLRLVLEYVNVTGMTKKREFRTDLSFNHPGEGYSRIKDEWSDSSQYKAIFGFFDNLLKYGEEAYDLILRYEREAYANDAAYRQTRDRFEFFEKETAKYKECVRELYIPEEWGSIPWEFYYSDGVERVFIPSSVTSIGKVPYTSRLQQVFCLSPVPPRIGDTRFLSDHGAHLYVPKDSVQAYKDDRYWSQAFLIINGI